MSTERNTVEEFEITEFIKRHLKVSAWANERSQVYTSKELLELVRQVKAIFKNEPPLVALSPPCSIVGDIHGQYRDLIRILNLANTKSSGSRGDKKIAISRNRFMFLGDYVDRGPHSVECICLMFSLKIFLPDQYMLLRGNHETKAINYAYGFREEMVNKLGTAEGIQVWESFNDAFAHMPLAGIVGGKILCMHGGISPHLNSLDDILKIPKPLVDVNANPLALDLLWADPIDISSIYAANDNPQFLKNVVRGLSCTFNEAAVRELCTKLNIELIVRAHQVMDSGFKFFANRKLMTVFSAPRYMNESNNKGAVLRVNEDGAISITTLKAKQITPTGKQNEITQGKSLSEVEAKLKESSRSGKGPTSASLPPTRK